MIYDVLEIFKKEYEMKGDKLILDNYVLKDGLYVKIDNNENLEYFIFSNDKKIERKENCFKDLNGTVNHQMYEWFKERDYYSSVLDNAKVFDAPKKIIHNNNYLTLFMKIEKFIEVDFIHIKDKLFKKVLSFSDFKSKSEKNILKNYCSKIKSLNRKKDLFTKYKVLNKKFEELRMYSKEYSPKMYLKVFFDEDIAKYKEESEIYFALKIFNDNKYSVYANNLIYGLSNSNMGLNSKKPYLENKTRKLSTPFMLTNENARLNKIFFDWLYFQDYKNQYPLQKNIFITKYSDNGQAVINDFDYIPLKIDRLEEPIVIKNHLRLKHGKALIEDEKIEYLNILEDKVDEILYNRQLKNNYYGEVYKKLDNRFASFIYSTRDAMSRYFKKYDDRGFYIVIKKYATYLAIEHLVRSWFLLAGLSLNLKFSLLEYKGEEVMDIKKMQESIKSNIKKGTEYQSLEDEEFFYLCGQVVKYLLQQSESYQKSGDMLEPFLKAKNIQKLKDEIKFTFLKYKHKIGLNHIQFNNALALITAYDSDKKFDMDSFLVGVLSENVFYMKNEEE